MKLTEIKNNLAKLYYLPTEDKLLISDFLTINDGNQKIIAQVISAESTSKGSTNCAVLKFTLNLSPNNAPSAYNGYVPSLDSTVQRTEPGVLKKIFSKSADSIRVGEFSTSTEVDLHVKKSFLDDFLYIQSDRIENTKSIFNTLTKELKSAVFVDVDGSIKPNVSKEFVLCENFKLPVNFETLNYIYENDLDGLTVEQKAIVQDIVLEILDYIKSEETGYIPFSTLISVVDDIYKTDKSVGIILFRNKLIKYHQQRLFASTENEFKELFAAIDAGDFISLNLQKAATNWKKEAIGYLVNNAEKEMHLVMNTDDDSLDKNLAAQIYQKSNIKPIIASGYNSQFANIFKSYAKNLILFSPEEIQKSYPTYSTFLSRLTNNEYIISGAQTYYTPIIVIPVPAQKPIAPAIEEIPLVETLAEEIKEIPETISVEDIMEIEADIDDEDCESIENDEIPDIKNIFEETVQAEIAKDVDGMFYSNTKEGEDVEDTIEIDTEAEDKSDDEDSYEDMFSDEDLDILDDLNAEPEEEMGEDESEELGDSSSFYNHEPENDSETIDLENIREEDLIIDQVNEGAVEIKKAPVPNIPIYKTAYDENLRTEETIKVAEGNIVYHEKYGRGVVEQIISYGKKTLCSIQFDNIGRRLLDPNIADLKQA